MSNKHFTDKQVKELEFNPLDEFKDMRKENSGRPRMKDLTTEEQIEQLNHEINILKQENYFLKRVISINRKQLLKMHKNKP